MSIEMENPTTLLEKIDAAANLVAQMMFAHKMGDDSHFMEVYERASTLLSEATTMADTGGLSCPECNCNKVYWNPLEGYNECPCGYNWAD